MTHERVLFHGGRIYANGLISANHDATAICVENDRIVWVGLDADAPQAHTHVDLNGLLVTPGFVDAHVHATSTGLVMTGLDLSGARDATELLTLLTQFATSQPEGVILGHGWDDSTWAQQRLPSRSEIDSAAPGRAVYLSRIDVHSALVSSRLVDLAPSTRSCEGFHAEGPLSREAHHCVRDVALGRVDATQRRAAQRAFLTHAAALGVVSVHEMAGPTISTEGDLADLMSLASEGVTPLVTGYWGELATEGGLEKARDLGAIGAAGDLFVDGSLGSRTACLHDVYADDIATTGAAYLTSQQISDHVVACTHSGLQAGFHVIGDAACSRVTQGFRDAARVLGAGAVRHARHRIEHAEMLSIEDIESLSDLNVAASMQPMFDALWGGDQGMYAARLGSARSGSMNRLASLREAGARVMLGSDAPVTALGPWLAVRAAVKHQTPRESLDLDSAFFAHTSAAWYGAGIDDAGPLSPKFMANFAIWDASGIDDLLDQGCPETVATVVSGRLIRDTGLASP
jgi:hypothetical protein